MKGLVIFKFLYGVIRIELRRGRRKFGRGIMYAFTGHHICEYPGCATLADHEIRNIKSVHLCCKHNDQFIAETTGGLVPGRTHD